MIAVGDGSASAPGPAPESEPTIRDIFNILKVMSSDITGLKIDVAGLRKDFAWLKKQVALIRRRLERITSCELGRIYGGVYVLY